MLKGRKLERKILLWMLSIEVNKDEKRSRVQYTRNKSARIRIGKFDASYRGSFHLTLRSILFRAKHRIHYLDCFVPHGEPATGRNNFSFELLEEESFHNRDLVISFHQPFRSKVEQTRRIILVSTSLRIFSTC